MKILHLGFDSSFVDFLVGRFDLVAPGVNELVVVSPSGAGERRAGFEGPVHGVRPDPAGVADVLQRAADADLVIAHSMTEFAALVCAQLPPGPKVLWSGFGYDYYVGAAGRSLAGPLTSKLLPRLYDGREPDGNGRLVKLAEGGSLEAEAVDLVRRLAAERSDYFSAPVDADLDVFREAFPGFHGEYRQLNYGDVDSMCPAGDQVVAGDDILVGNSSSWANNHLEAFQLLAQTDLGSRRVIVPLTYGSPPYRQAVIEAGREQLGDRFVPLVDHLPIGEYLDLMASCGVVLFTHHRQQGVGNVAAALYQGSTLYLHRRNPLFHWLRSRGVRVRQASAVRSGLPTGPPSEEELARNRAVVEEMWAADRVDANVRDLVASLDAPPPGRIRRLRSRWR